jgi:6-phosphogluconolactonase (cycloisomerase 2 family)
MICLTTIGSCGGRSTQQGEGAAGERLYVLNFDSADVSAFDVDATGALSQLRGSPSPLRGSPQSAAAAPGRKLLYVAEAERVASYAIGTIDGDLKLLGDTPTLPNVEVVAASPSENVLYVAHCTENGGSISVLPLDSNGGMARETLQSIPTALCINSLAIDPAGRFLYVSSQYGYDGDLEGFSIDQTSGTLTPIAGSPFASFLAVAIAIDPNGKHLYVCDQDGFVRSYDIDARTGALTDLGFKAKTGGNPFSMAIDRAGHRLFVGNWSGDSVSSYVLNPSTGLPDEIPGSPFAAGASPRVLAIDASSRFVYVNDQGSPTIDALEIGSSGELSEVAGSPFTAGAQPIAAVFAP